MEMLPQQQKLQQPLALPIAKKGKKGFINSCYSRNLNTVESQK
jgi:hypothetical protein